MAAKAMVRMAEIGKTGRGLPVYRALLKGVSFLLTTSQICDRIKSLVVSRFNEKAVISSDIEYQ